MLISLKVALAVSGYSQRDLAAAAGIPEVRLSNLIRGIQSPTKDERVALMKATGMGEDIFAPQTQSPIVLEVRS